MRLAFATDDLKVAGRCFDGMPLILGDDCWPLEPAQSFLWHHLTIAGGAESKLTWEAYGRSIYDFFAFLNANQLKWDDEAAIGMPSVVAHYKDWSLGELGLSKRTVNQRLRLVVKFYEWALQQGFVSTLPFGYREVRAIRTRGKLAHLEGGHSVVAKPTVLTREHRAMFKFSTKDQVTACRKALGNSSQRLLFELMVRVGLRSCEARTFPLKYVFNPGATKGLRQGQLLRVHLDPADMSIKYDRPRSVEIPWSLMEDLWAYSLHARGVRSRPEGSGPRSLILSANGSAFARSSVVSMFAALERKVGFYVRAHMLRHTYGTYTLAALRKSDTFQGEPLLYVRDRMGHSDVQTTAIYLHLINLLDARIALEHEEEIDRIFRSDVPDMAKSA